jgi:hypothetical protein
MDVLRKYIRYRPRLAKFLLYSQAIVVEAERRKGGGGVNPQCLCQRPPSALSQPFMPRSSNVRVNLLRQISRRMRRKIVGF